MTPWCVDTHKSHTSPASGRELPRAGLVNYSYGGSVLPPNPLRPFRLSNFACAKSRPGRSADADFVAPLL